MSKNKNYTSKNGNDYVIKGGVHTGYGAYDKDGTRKLDDCVSYDNPVEVIIAIDKQEEKETQE
jgi:recombinational DNA repair protein RecR